MKILCVGDCGRDTYEIRLDACPVTSDSDGKDKNAKVREDPVRVCLRCPAIDEKANRQCGRRHHEEGKPDRRGEVKKF